MMIKNDKRKRFIVICISLCTCACMFVGIISLCGLNVNADTLSDLNGTTWSFNNTISEINNTFVSSSVNCTISYYSNNVLYSFNSSAISVNNSSWLYFKSNSSVSPFDTVAYVINAGNGYYQGWNYYNKNDSNQVQNITQVNNVTITFNSSLTNSNFIAWLYDNANLVLNVTFNTNGGVLESGFNNPLSLSSLYLPSVLPTCTKDGYIFSGWYFDSSFNNPALPTVAINGSVTLYAKYYSVGQNVVVEIINIITSGINSFGTNITSGINSMISGVALYNGALSVFLVLVCCFGGVALCIGLSKFVVIWLQGFGR